MFEHYHGLKDEEKKPSAKSTRKSIPLVNRASKRTGRYVHRYVRCKRRRLKVVEEQFVKKHV